MDFFDEAYKDEMNVWRWKSNDRVPPDDCLEEAGIDDGTRKRCKMYRDEETTKFIKEYRKSMEDYEPDAEHMYEMRAAFGEDVDVVNVITGKTYRT